MLVSSSPAVSPWDHLVLCSCDGPSPALGTLFDVRRRRTIRHGSPSVSASTRSACLLLLFLLYLLCLFWSED